MDEADELGLQLDLALLQEALGIPVVGAALANGRGAQAVKEALAGRLAIQPASHTAACHQAGCACSIPASQPTPVCYPLVVEKALGEIEGLLDDEYGLARRAIALLLVQHDSEVAALVQRQQPEEFTAIMQSVESATRQYHQPLSFIISQHQRRAAQRLLIPVLRVPHQGASSFRARLSDID